MIKSIFGSRQKDFKEKLIEAAMASGGDKKAAFDMTYGTICVLSKILHRLYKGFLTGDFSERSVKSVATVASIIVLSMERELEAFDLVIDSEQAVITGSIFILTSIFKKSKSETDSYYKFGINAYKVILSNYGKSESVKAYFNEIYDMTLDYINTHDEQVIDKSRQVVIN